jgi:hypothetical protein
MRIDRGLSRSRLSGAVLALLLAGCGKERVPQVGPEPLASNNAELGTAYDDGTRELVLELAPVDVPANADHHGVQQPEPREATVPVDGWVHGYRVELLDKNGQAVPQTLLHHVNIIVPGRRELFSQIMQRLGAAGHETGPVKAPRLLGYPLNRSDRVLLTAMLHNPTATAYEGVRVRVRFPHVPRTAYVRPIRVYPFYLDVMPPAGIHEYDLPPGSSEKSWEGKPAVSGRILGVSGHVHKYATALRLESVTEQKVVYEAKPILDDAGNVTGMPKDMLFWKLGVPIHSEHTYRLTVYYENPTGDTIPGGGMGALGGIMLASRGQEWPAIDPRDPEYLRDVDVTWRKIGHSGASKDSTSKAQSHAHH